MKRLREIIFEDSSLSEEEEDGNDFETVLGMIFNYDIDGRGEDHSLTTHNSIVIERRACQHQEILFAPNSTYLKKYFHRRFRMHTSLFLTVRKAGKKYDDWFKLRRNAWER